MASFKDMLSATSILNPEEIFKRVSTGAPPCLVYIYPPGHLMGCQFPLTGDRHVIGRDPECSIVVETGTLSRRHAALQKTGPGWEIKDFGLTNGVLVNDVPTRATALRDRDIINLGNVVFKFLEGDNIEMEFHEQLYQTKIRDALTQIHNRDYFFEYLDREIAISARYGTYISVAMMDLDHFKQINDRYGHPVGDQALVGVASRVKTEIRHEDIFARYGGEEFAIMLTHSPPEKAILFAEKIRRLICEKPFAMDGVQLKLSASFGVVTHKGQKNVRRETLIKEADRKLYQAKNQGRNIVIG